MHWKSQVGMCDPSREKPSWESLRPNELYKYNIVPVTYHKQCTPPVCELSFQLAPPSLDALLIHTGA